MDFIFALTIAFAITSSITIFDTRLTRARKEGIIPDNEPMCPPWVLYIYLIHFILAGIILLMNWQYAIFIFIIFYIITYILPVFEILGNIIMRPFKPKK